MNDWKDDNEKYWLKSGTGFSFKDDEKPKSHDFSEITKFSVRSNRQQPQASSIAPSSQPANIGGPVSLISESDLIPPTVNCTSCRKIITESETIKFEGNKVFTNELCWKHWIDKMVDQEYFNLKELVSYAAKKYFLGRVCATCNGRLIIKTILNMKGVMSESEFSALLFDNDFAYNHYTTFLREARQKDEKLLIFLREARQKDEKLKIYAYEEQMKKLREIMTNNIQVDASGVHNFIQELLRFKDDAKLNPNFTQIQSEMVEEYAALLNWQAKNCENFLNMSLVATVIENKLSYHATKDSSTARFLKENFKMTPEEFFWTCIMPVLISGKISEIDKILKGKDFGQRPAITYERIVSFLYSCSKEPDNFKMQCLLKISNTEDLVDCANQYKLLEHLRKYCADNRETGHLKRIDQYLQNVRK